MTPEDKHEIKTMLSDILIVHNAKNESLFDVINYKLDAIEIQTTKTNGRVLKLEDKVQTLQLNENQHIINCPQAKRIEKLSEDLLTYKEKNSEDLMEYKMVIKYPKAMIIGAVVFALVVIIIAFKDIIF